MRLFERKIREKGIYRCPQLVTEKNMPFEYVEAYKALRTNLNFITGTSDASSFMVTSALPEEGKSNVVLNLSATLAGSGKKVIIVDCDLRKPVIHKYLKLGHVTRGLTSILTGDAELNKCIYEIEKLNVFVLAAGTIPPNPSELLEQERMKKLIEVLKRHFDYVILDAPPVSLVTDAVILGQMVDGVLLVVRSCYASRETIRLAQKKLTDVNIKIVGVILNRCKAKKKGKRTNYSYGYAYYKE